MSSKVYSCSLTFRAPHEIHIAFSMQKLAVKMRAQRFENGALRLENIKLVFRLDENGLPGICQPYIIKDSNKYYP